MKTKLKICALLLAVSGCGTEEPAAPLTPAPDLGVLGIPSNATSSNPVEKALRQFDANGNGVLDPDERASALARVERRREWRRQALVAEFDANGDGALDAGELQTAKDVQASRRARQKSIVLQKFDANADGVIDPQERATQRERVSELVARARADSLRRWDRNKNGVLDLDEEEAMRASLTARRRAKAQ